MFRVIPFCVSLQALPKTKPTGSKSYTLWSELNSCVEVLFFVGAFNVKVKKGEKLGAGIKPLHAWGKFDGGKKEAWAATLALIDETESWVAVASKRPVAGKKGSVKG